MNIRFRRVVEWLAIAGAFCFITYQVGIRIDGQRTRSDHYLSGVTHPDGSSTLYTVGDAPGNELNREQYRRALDAIARHDFIGAEALLRGIVERTPDDLPALQGLGTTLFHQRRYEESRATFQRILTLDPHFFRAHTALGSVDRVLGKYPEAVEEYSLALKESPTDGFSYYGRGIAYAYIGKRAEALADFQRALEFLPPKADVAIDARNRVEQL